MSQVNIGASVIESQAVLVQLSTGRFSARRKVDSLSGISTDADKDRLHLGAELLRSEELDRICQFDSESRRLVMARALPVSLFAAGVYVIPVASVSEVDDLLSDRLSQRARLTSDFCAVYESRAALGRLALGSLADASQYPSIDAVERQFRMSWGFFSLGAPGSVEGVRADIYSRERDRIASEFDSALAEARDALRAMCAGMVEHLIDRLQPGDNGKKKRFEASTVQKLQEFCSGFSARNLANDAELQAVVSQIRGALAGVSAEDLRGSAWARRDVVGRLSEVKAALDGLLVDAPVRAFRVMSPAPEAPAEVG